VDTRLAKLDRGDSDALVLAVAGLTRLGHAGRIDEVLPSALVPSAPGQGSLALQVRAGDDPGAAAAVGCSMTPPPVPPSRPAGAAQRDRRRLPVTDRRHRSRGGWAARALAGAERA
jgi:hypothetical protein